MTTQLYPAREIAGAPITHRRSGISPSALGWGAIAVVGTLWATSIVIGFVPALTLLTLVSFVAVIVGVTWPAIGLLGVSLLCTLDAMSRVFLLTGGWWRWNTFNYVLLIVIALFSPLLLRLRDVTSRLLLLLCVLVTLEVLLSPDWLQGMEDALNMVTALGVLVYLVRARQSRESWYWMGLVCGTAGAIGGLMYYVQRTNLTFINPNAWVFAPLTALFALCLGFPTGLRLRRQLAPMLLALANTAWVFLSGSRGGMVLAAICLLFLLLVMDGVRRRATFFIVGLALAIGVSSQFGGLEEHALHRVNVLLDPQLSMVDRTSERIALVLGGAEIFEAHPLGVGTGGFAVAFSKLPPIQGLASYERLGTRSPAHSGWIKMLAENGLPGIVLMVGCVMSFALCGLRHRAKRLRLIGLFTTVVLALAFATNEYQNKGLWLLVAGAIVLLQYTPEARRSSDTMQHEPPGAAPGTAPEQPADAARAGLHA
ncbi:MAG TPA: O-antigen ligase family protein [Gemmatimonadaceae bacterium]|nr:O-antigen ligase family protein [Gemmatimonadaceae bacterium]